MRFYLSKTAVFAKNKLLMKKQSYIIASCVIIIYFTSQKQSEIFSSQLLFFFNLWENHGLKVRKSFIHSSVISVFFLFVCFLTKIIQRNHRNFQKLQAAADINGVGWTWEKEESDFLEGLVDVQDGSSIRWMMSRELIATRDHPFYRIRTFW